MALSFSYAVLQWARSKPAAEAYDYCDSGNCALCQFLSDTGRAARPSVSPYSWSDRAMPTGKWVDHEFGERLENSLCSRPHTFGALASRLERALAK